MSKSFGLRRQRAVPKHNVGAMACGKEVFVHWSQTSGKVEKFIEVLQKQMVWIRRGRHLGAKRVVEEVARNAAVVLQQTLSKRGGVEAHERLFDAE